MSDNGLKTSKGKQVYDSLIRLDQSNPQQAVGDLNYGFVFSNAHKRALSLRNLRAKEVKKVSEPKPNPKPYSLHSNYLQEIWLFWLFQTNPLAEPVFGGLRPSA
ncbi:MAG: hypothetical protein GY841_10985 [FCB group bacterium]|nr:hypothetical protein [FCB group bacterium]